MYSFSFRYVRNTLPSVREKQKGIPTLIQNSQGHAKDNKKTDEKQAVTPPSRKEFRSKNSSFFAYKKRESSNSQNYRNNEDWDDSITNTTSPKRLTYGSDNDD